MIVTGYQIELAIRRRRIALQQESGSLTSVFDMNVIDSISDLEGLLNEYQRTVLLNLNDGKRSLHLALVRYDVLRERLEYLESVRSPEALALCIVVSELQQRINEGRGTKLDLVEAGINFHKDWFE